MEPFSPPPFFARVSGSEHISDLFMTGGGVLTLSFLFFPHHTWYVWYIGLEQEGEDGEIKGMLPLNGLCSHLSSHLRKKRVQKPSMPIHLQSEKKRILPS